MRYLILFVFAALCFGQEPKYEMDNYVVGFLKKGPNWNSHSKEEAAEIGKGHMAHIKKMGATGKLIVAGPFMDNGDIRGILIFKTTLEDAKALASEDPGVKAGRFELELHPWFAAKGLSVAPPK